MTTHYTSNIHLRSPEQKETNRGGITIAYRPTDDKHIYEVAFTVCSDKDQYVRKIGSKFARERLEANPMAVDVHGAFAEKYFEHHVAGLDSSNFSQERINLIKSHIGRMAELDADFWVNNPIRSFIENVIVDSASEYLYSED